MIYKRIRQSILCGQLLTDSFGLRLMIENLSTGHPFLPNSQCTISDFEFFQQVEIPDVD